MQDSEFILPLTLALVSGVVAFIGSYKFLVDGIQVYQKSFVRRVGTGLRESFVYLNPKTLFAINLLVMGVGGFLGFLIGHVVGMLVAVLLTAIAPRIVLGMVRKKRADKFIYQLPDCLNSMASSLRGGTNLARAMELAAREQAAPISEEFSVVLSEYKLGRLLEESLVDMQKRIGRQEIELMNSAIAISRSVGGNLADTLETLASSMREKDQIEGKIDAMTAMGRMQGSVAIFLPFGVAIFLYIQDPKSMSVLIHEPLGLVVLSVVVIMLMSAYMLIRKITRIDV